MLIKIVYNIKSTKIILEQSKYKKNMCYPIVKYFSIAPCKVIALHLFSFIFGLISLLLIFISLFQVITLPLAIVDTLSCKGRGDSKKFNHFLLSPLYKIYKYCCRYGSMRESYIEKKP